MSSTEEQRNEEQEQDEDLALDPQESEEVKGGTIITDPDAGRPTIKVTKNGKTTYLAE